MKGKIPLEMITDLEKTEVDDRSGVQSGLFRPVEYCLFVKTDDDFNKALDAARKVSF